MVGRIVRIKGDADKASVSVHRRGQSGERRRQKSSVLIYQYFTGALQNKNASVRSDVKPGRIGQAGTYDQAGLEPCRRSSISVADK